MAGGFCQFANEKNEAALGSNFSGVEKDSAPADKKRLLALRRREQIKTVRRDVVGRGTERQQHKKNNRPADAVRHGNRQGDA